MKTSSQRVGNITEAIGRAHDHLETLEAAEDVWGPLFEKLGVLTKLMDGIGEVRRGSPAHVMYADYITIYSDPSVRQDSNDCPHGCHESTISLIS